MSVLVLHLFRIGVKPLQQDTTLPEEHAKCCYADNGPDESPWDGASIYYVRHPMHGGAVSKLLKHVTDILLVLLILAVSHAD